MVLVDRVARSTVEVDVATGPVESFGGLRRLLAALADAGADFGDLPRRHPAEWGRLTAPSPENARALAGIALSASERRLHRESEQTFRVLAVGAAAVCHGSESLQAPVVLRGVGRTDLPSLRGFVRAREYGAAMGLGRMQVVAADAVQVPVLTAAADTRAERARALQALGLDVDVSQLRVMRPDQQPAGGAGSGRTADAVLYQAALATGAPPADRLRAALAYCRSSFYSSNWEGMALVATACLPLAARLTRAELVQVADGEDDDWDDQAIEYEPALLRHRADLSAYLLKVLGVQASFRGLQDEALEYFRGMRQLDEQISAELRAQSHLYCALTLAKRQHRLPEAVGELETGFSTVQERTGEPASVRRERGWLHNLRGLTLFRQGDLVAAFDHEKAALACIEGGSDASSVHLRVNLVSNISVLQESAGRLSAALKTWERFRTDGVQSDAKFVKHHAYRTGGLKVLAGDVEGGLPLLTESLRRSTEAADDFHEFEIAAEVGTLLLGRQRGVEAADHYERAAQAAARLGDPYRMAVAAVGLSAATRSAVPDQVAQLAALSVTQATEARALVDGCRGGADAVSLLPRVRTKLNRPFDLINL
ncbi:MAG TPA: hypothetical protein VI248_14160 [Kineosporiaceae bacterium]